MFHENVEDLLDKALKMKEFMRSIGVISMSFMDWTRSLKVSVHFEGKDLWRVCISDYSITKQDEYYIHLCPKCKKAFLNTEMVWCGTCGTSYCKECVVVGLPKNYSLPSYIEEQDLEGWTGDRGFVTDECANCYMDWIDESEGISEDKYTKEDALNL